MDVCRGDGKFQRSVKTLNLNQFSKFKVYKREHKILSLTVLFISF